jgi:hypothetical protein
MTANDASASGAGASSRAAQMWDQANWPHIEAEVKRLQVRIAKGTVKLTSVGYVSCQRVVILIR